MIKFYGIKPEWCWGDGSEQKKAIQTEALAAVDNHSIEMIKMNELPKLIESEYEEKYGENKMVCPYCGYSHHVEGEDYSIGENRIEECGNCGKNFKYSTSIDVTHITTPDCDLNGGEHVYVERQPVYFTKVEKCTTCGHTRYGEPLVK